MVKASYKDHWTFPGGIVDENESPKHAALREVQEEIGIRLDEGECQFLGSVYTASGGIDLDRLNFAFLITVPSQALQISVPNDEIEEARWVSFGDITLLSRPRGSYTKYQIILTGAAPRGSYFEIFPQTSA